MIKIKCRYYFNFKAIFPMGKIDYDINIKYITNICSCFREKLLKIYI